jgi:hypothetical protein
VLLDALDRDPVQVGRGHDLADDTAGDGDGLVVEILHATIRDRGLDVFESARAGVLLAMGIERGSHGRRASRVQVSRRG